VFTIEYPDPKIIKISNNCCVLGPSPKRKVLAGILNNKKITGIKNAQ
jgi:hypothetical protein